MRRATPFPKGCVLRRAWFHAGERFGLVGVVLLMLLAGGVLAAVWGSTQRSLVTLPGHVTVEKAPGFLEILAAGFVGSVLAALLFVGGLMALELVRYRVTGWKDQTWHAACEQPSDSGLAGLELRSRAVIPPFDPRLAYQECHLLKPDGDVVVIPNKQIQYFSAGGVTRLTTWYVVKTTGRYEARWYGSKTHDGRRLFEITRATFELHT